MASNPKRDKRTHDGIRSTRDYDYTCAICDDTFVTPQGFASHMRKHAKEENRRKQLASSQTRSDMIYSKDAVAVDSVSITYYHITRYLLEWTSPQLTSTMIIYFITVEHV